MEADEEGQADMQEEIIHAARHFVREIDEKEPGLSDIWDVRRFVSIAGDNEQGLHTWQMAMGTLYRNLKREVEKVGKNRKLAFQNLKETIEETERFWDKMDEMKKEAV